MELTDSFLTLLQNFAPVFTAPTYQTFVVIVTGWIISQRHRYVTEVIFSSGRVGDGHWSRFPRCFSHAAWDIDTFSMRLAKLVVTILAPGATFFWAGVIAPAPGIMRLFWAFSPSNPPESPSQEESSLANMPDTLEARCRSDGPPAGPRSIDPLPGSRSFLTVSAVA